MALILIAFFKTLGLKLIVFLKYLLIDCTVHVINTLPKIPLIFKYFVKSKEAVYLVLLFNQLLLKQLNKRFKQHFLVSGRTNCLGLNARSGVIIGVYP
jgi:hypothetical protein